MSKRILVIILAIIFAMSPISALANFSSDPDAIEQAAKSVLMLEVFDANDELIATGSGFVAFNNRTIVTNHHVIEDADSIIANSDDGYQYLVTKVLIADAEKDIAICSFMSPTDLKPLEFNADGELKRAESIVAIGSPIGITNTVSLGNISALYKDADVSWIQFTAPISHGSSGGALFDNAGKVIGVTSASYEDTQNLNLAVHISEVEKLYQSWDGSMVSFEDYAVIVNATPTPMPTPIPTVTPDVTEKPQKYPMLKKGDKGLDVYLLKEELIRLGYLEDHPSYQTGRNEFNEAMETAVLAFNWQHFNMPTDVADYKMQKLIFEGVPTKCKGEPIQHEYPELSKGSKGKDVERLQRALIRQGYLDGTADGVFGNKTAKAVDDCIRWRNSIFENDFYTSWKNYGVVTNELQQWLYGYTIHSYGYPY